MTAAHAGARRLWPWLFLGLASLCISVAIVWAVDPATLWRPAPAAAPPSSGTRPVEGSHSIRLFLPGAGGQLTEMARQMPRQRLARDEILAALGALAEGPGERPLAGVEIRHLFLDDFGIVYIDCGPGLERLLGTPAKAELAIQAVLATLTASFEPVKRVQFLVEGHEPERELQGRDLSRPLAPAAAEPPPA